MKLTAEQYAEISNFASIGYNFAQIAKIFCIDGGEFLQMMQEDPEIEQAFDRGVLQADAEIRLNLLSSAKSSITAAQEFKKMIRDSKNREMLQSLDSLSTASDPPHALQRTYNDSLEHYHTLQEFLSSNPSSSPLPENLQEYWFRLNTAHDLFRSFHIRSRGRKFIVGILRKKFPDISEATAYRYISEAINFFNVNMSKDDWRNVLCDDLDKVKAAAWEMGNLDLVIKAVKEQANIQAAAPDQKDIPLDLLQQKIIIVSNNPEDFGLEQVSKKKLWDMIRNFDIDENERIRIAGEAGIPKKYYDSAEEVVPE
jgi:hypothetical protein